MLDVMYETALKKKSGINQEVGRLEDINVDASEWWVDCLILESEEDKNIAAGDGSINKRRFVPFIFYAIDAEAILHTPDGVKRVKTSELDIIAHHKYVEDRLRNYMSIFEIKNALRLFNEYHVDFFLFDGSILGNLIRPLPIEKQLNDSMKEQIQDTYAGMMLDGIYQELNHNKTPGITSLIISEMYDKEFGDNTEEVIYLETLENLLAITELLKYNKQVVAISKTSTSNEYFNEKIPDMAIFDRHSKKQGYSKPRYINVSDAKREFPVRDYFVYGLTFTVFYARLDDHKNILKFELPYHASEADILNLLKYIKKMSADGYPLLLKLAHDEVVIRKNDIENLSKIIGFQEKSGREMLNE